ncbi:3-methylmercaptopropionyl-CoA dehydrogenase [Tepidimonas sediminis]|uniref:3-methylmercaptopropionyl-CoA dehydrogenase n=1 Tax=Tepidimonas sediminis TaxID=2588941 RepID=A0A554WPG8_9BURK|nr:acyl-CoA dehydrogenase [Tepidimonas sediminis]TSE25455.1 3-methylmercaptopropionyl-CoA dehydrogenase [Tepidimonas sediminis]
MTSGLRAAIDFLLHDWLQVEALCARPRYAEHARDTFDAVLDTCERLARDKFAPHNRTVDVQEPRMEDGRVVLPACTHEAWRAYAESGMLAAAQDAGLGGMQLPYVVEAAGNAFFAAASVSISAAMLTVGNANLLLAHGTPAQRRAFALPQLAGRFAGTMCLSEPQAGSSLSDITTRAEPDGPDFEVETLGPRYRLRGAKMWISAGEHELTDNIVHLVLAKIPGPDGRLVPGVKGISLFIVPKWLVTPDGQRTERRNDVALAGLNHKCGWRGTPNTLLNFGEGRHPVTGPGVGPGLDGQGAGAVAYRVGAVGDGLRCMFHMMNEARIGVGMAATMLGMAGYLASLEYARTRLQGRPVGPAGKDPAQPPVRIIEHADVRRMLLAQKAYCEGALALELYCARLVDEQRTGEAAAAEEARLLLELLTPIAKSWPSEWCLEANSLAIQVHGGYGYTRDFPVEQYWRDNRLNMIHEGTHGIQALDLLGRKVLLEQGRALALLGRRVEATAARADAVPALAGHAAALRQAWQALLAATHAAWEGGDPVAALANAVPYLQAFGHTVIAWLWLDVALVAAGRPDAASLGRVQACRYFFHYELPRTGPWLQVVRTRDLTCATMPEEAF